MIIASAEAPKLPVGTRIRFKVDIREDATGDHPAFIYARNGDGGVITGHGCGEGYWVKWDGWPKAAFGASRDEFEPVMSVMPSTGSADDEG